MTEIFSHTAIDMYAQNLQTGAAVGTADAARITVAAIYIWIQDNFIARLESLWIIFRNGLNDTSQLMTNDSRIRNKIIGTTQSADIGTTDTCTYDLNKRFARTRNRLFNINYAGYTWFLNFYCFHNNTAPLI